MGSARAKRKAARPFGVGSLARYNSAPKGVKRQEPRGFPLALARPDIGSKGAGAGAPPTTNP